MQIHRNICLAIVEALQQIFEQKKQADHLVGKLLKSNPKWGSRDRKFIAESIYEIVRWWRYFIYVSGQSYEDQQISEINYWKILGTYLHLFKEQDLTWTEFEEIDIEKLKQNIESAASYFEVRQSIPDWLQKMGSEQLGNKWEEEMTALNTPTQLIIRVNTLKVSRNNLQKLLFEQEIETTTIDELPDALVVNKRINVNNLEIYNKGFFEIQDASSQFIAPSLHVFENAFVIDACAGAGGKSLHLASLLKNKGKILALDVEGYKLRELGFRARRAGASCIETALIDGDLMHRYKQTADFLLLDVPCSGLGVLKRNPDAKWKLNEAFLNEIQAEQQQILKEYSSMLKTNGTLVYATCSILPAENNLQVQKFIENQKGAFQLIKERNILPSSGFDGFYFAVLEKIA
jgi:16S rRNA (cytosine967-C5)-methyltransferase